MRSLKVVASGFQMNLKMLGTSSFFLLTSIVQPIIFATVAFYTAVHLIEKLRAFRGEHSTDHVDRNAFVLTYWVQHGQY